MSTAMITPLASQPIEVSNEIPSNTIGTTLGPSRIIFSIAPLSPCFPMYIPFLNLGGSSQNVSSPVPRFSYA